MQIFNNEMGDLKHWLEQQGIRVDWEPPRSFFENSPSLRVHSSLKINGAHAELIGIGPKLMQIMVA
jgi:hypothetical protein